MARFENDLQLAAALALGASVEQAARQAGVSVRTAWRRLRCLEFRDQVIKMRGEMRDRMVGELVGLASQAVAVLRQLLQASGEAVRLGAARTVLDIVRHDDTSIRVEGVLEHRQAPYLPTPAELEEVSAMADRFGLWRFIDPRQPPNGDGSDTGDRSDEE